jgi:hypothetical protein
VAALAGAGRQAPHGDELAFWRRAGERLLQCLDELPLAQRSAFLLHHDDGLALAEVAASLEDRKWRRDAKTRLRYAMCQAAHVHGATRAHEDRSSEVTLNGRESRRCRPKTSERDAWAAARCVAARPRAPPGRAAAALAPRSSRGQPRRARAASRRARPRPPGGPKA